MSAQRMMSTFSRVFVCMSRDTLPPVCKTCKYFEPLTNSSDKIKYGKCLNFGEIDVITGEKTFLYASTARNFSCKGKFYEKKT